MPEYLIEITTVKCVEEADSAQEAKALAVRTFCNWLQDGRAELSAKLLDEDEEPGIKTPKKPRRKK